MPLSDFVRRHEAAFRDFHIFLVGALNSYFVGVCVCVTLCVVSKRVEEEGYDMPMRLRRECRFMCSVW